MLLNLPGRCPCIFFHGDFIIDIIFIAGYGKNYQLALKVEERNKAAREAEEDGDLNKAVRFYEQNIREDYADKFAFERLMIIYRKDKEYKNELRVIKEGLKFSKKI